MKEAFLFLLFDNYIIQVNPRSYKAEVLTYCLISQGTGFDVYALPLQVVYLLSIGESQAESRARAYFFPQLQTNFLFITKIHKNNQNEVNIVQTTRLHESRVSAAQAGDVDDSIIPSKSSIII